MLFLSVQSTVVFDTRIYNMETVAHEDAVSGSSSKWCYILHTIFSALLLKHILLMAEKTFIVIGEESGCFGLGATDFDTITAGRELE